jgi:hypothetical protein
MRLFSHELMCNAAAQAQAIKGERYGRVAYNYTFEKPALSSVHQPDHWKLPT